MRLLITTPTAVIVDQTDVRHVRGEDETGAFGILPGHTDFLTALGVSVLSWRGEVAGEVDVEAHAALRGGVLRVTGGKLIEVATREAVVGEDLDLLEANVLRRFREEEESEHVAHGAAARLELAAIGHIRAYLHPEEAGAHRAATSVVARNHGRDGGAS